MDTPSDLSYLHTPLIKPFNYTTITKVAKENAHLRPQQEIFIHRELDGSRSSLTNASLYQQAEHLAKYLVTQGITRNDVIALIGPNTLEMIIGMLGTMLAGSVVLNISINMKNSDIKALLQLTHTKFILVDSGSNDSQISAVKKMLEELNVQTDEKREADQIEHIFIHRTDLDGLMTTQTLHTILSQNIDGVNLPHVYPEDNAFIFTTSGSTGKPKMVLHSHFHFTSNPFSFIPSADGYESTLYNNRTFCWIGGTPVSDIIRSHTRVSLNQSALMNSGYLDFLWRVLEEERCTDAFLDTSVIHGLIEMQHKHRKPRYMLQHIFAGGKLTDNYVTETIGQFCHEMVIVYGCTEGICITLNGPFDRSERLQTGDVGRAYQGVEIKVVDTNDLPAERGLIGRVQIRSPHLLKEYVGDPELTKQAFTEDRWFRTGDIGKVSSNGHLILLGRETDVFKRGTHMLNPALLELELIKMESIKEVCVVYVPDKKLNEETCVCYVTSGNITPDDILDYCKQNLYTENNVDTISETPTYFLQFQTFPKLESGKINNRVVRLDALVSKVRINLICQFYYRSCQEYSSFPPPPKPCTSVNDNGYY